MGMNEYEAASRLIQEYPALQSLAGERQAEIIEAAERKLGCTFPPTYRRFLKEYGAGGFGSDDFYGVIDTDFENSSVPDAIWATLTERRQANLPEELIEIFNTGGAEVYCIDLSVSHPDGESPVVSFYPGYSSNSQSRETIAQDFGSFLLARVERQLARRASTS